MMDNTAENKGAAESIRAFLDRLAAEGDSINTSLPLTLLSVDMEKREALFSTPVPSFSRNVYGTMHGGAICTVLDVAMALLCKAVIGEDTAPSLDMTVHFLRGIPVHSTLMLRASVMRAGSSIVVMHAQGWVENEASPAVCCTGSYYRLK